jgi:hypothetical protein
MRGPLDAAASLQGCGGCERGGVLAPKGRNDKEMRGVFLRFAEQRPSQPVMAGLLPAIPRLRDCKSKTWMPGSSPGKTANTTRRPRWCGL